MKIEQIYTGCLAQGAYYISSEGEAAIIDPLREVQPYVQQLKKDGVTLKYIFETHFHADFVSGHLSLADKTGAPIVFGATAEPAFDAIVATDNEEFKIGNVTIIALHTPGHTMESTTYLLRDENGKDTAIFSGDTLFLGDVGRPDLAQAATGLTTEELAGTLYNSLRTKIMTLADDVVVYPGHGAGSACGKNMSKETVGTIGDQKANNYALRADMTQEEFIKELLDGIPAPPSYFPQNVQMNKEGYQLIDEVMNNGLNPLSVSDFEAAAHATEAIVLDVRHPETFAKGFIPQSISVGLNGKFAPWVGTVIGDVKQPILLVTSPGTEEEAVTRLARVGFDQVLGFLDGGFDDWKKAGKEIDQVKSISATEFETDYTANATIVDVREAGEYNKQHIKDAVFIPLSELNSHISKLPHTENDIYLHCAGGYRSMIAASLLKARGHHNLIDIKGGFNKIKATDIPLTQEVECTSNQ